MNASDKVYMDRIDARLDLALQDHDVSEQPEFMLAIHTSDGHTFLAPYQTLQLVGLKPEDRMAENVSPAEVTIEFSGAVVKFEGEHLETAIRLLQQHRLRHLRESKHSSSQHGFAVRQVRCGPPKP